MPSDRSNALVDSYDRVLNWLRSPRRRRTSATDERVVPVRIDLVGEQPITDQNGQSSTTAPKPGGALAPLPDWQFNQPALLNKSRRTSSLITWTAIGGASFLIIWAAVAPLGETVAVQGKLQPGSKVKILQAPVPGVVDEVLVKDGQSVNQGDVVLRFDLRQARSSLTTAEAVRNRLLNENKILAAALGDQQASGLTSNQRLQLGNQAEDLSSRRQLAEEQLRASEARIAGLSTSLATTSNIAERYAILSRTGAVSEVQALETRNRADELRSSLASEERTAAGLRAALRSAQAAPSAELRAKIEENLRELSDLDGQIRQAQLQVQYGVLTAPSKGAIFDIDVSKGSVVEIGKPLLRVVPADALEAKVFIPNDAIGFIRTGQVAEISLNTFPSSQFGFIPAVVERIGSDSLTTEEMAETLKTDATGLFYPAILKLKSQHLKGASKPIPIKPGMALTADIQLRERTFLSIFTGFFEDRKREFERTR
ncbi:HlyD family efflux transporter periplasmic adaptor subunit [Synechococcus sp. J7-Johnson]|uniref:HlyD family efflux transporter periplasmic adaptor subunit n=1 Tax=Synechococcus sp. J7-Johnson TaxID=2823737 RepID=UPI0020CBA6C4|nr:HlyD family efflux transporter periplasmic adaptor subunit [Synechococcus sp. J7-Johnson]MCP9839605.1 HlyD family efflux transporter periplasmic adaptor subunit [Synechococcus sp. J7-Johnson]